MLHLMLRVGDLDRSGKFYEQAFGMKELRTSVNEAYKYTLKFFGSGKEEEVRYTRDLPHIVDNGL